METTNEAYDTENINQQIAAISKRIYTLSAAILRLQPSAKERARLKKNLSALVSGLKLISSQLSSIYCVRLLPGHDASPDQVKDGYLASFGIVGIYAKKEAKKKAERFGGEIEIFIEN